jgi:hypothetical protein
MPSITCFKTAGARAAPRINSEADRRYLIYGTAQRQRPTVRIPQANRQCAQKESRWAGYGSASRAVQKA